MSVSIMEHSLDIIQIAKGSTWDLDRYAESHQWSGVGFVFSKHRDSDVLDLSNWETVIEAMQMYPKQDWDIAHLTHWAVGWVEHIVYNLSNERITNYTVGMRERLANYPVLDEMQYSQMEWDENHPTEGYLAGKCLDPDCEHCGLEKA